MTRPGNVGRLARALRDGDESGADTLVRKALAEGALVPSRTHGTLYIPSTTPGQPRDDRDDDAKQPWGGHANRTRYGYRHGVDTPLCVKRHHLPPRQLALLRQVFAWLREDDHGEYVPHWATDTFIVSLYLENTVDLTSLLPPTTPDDAATVRRTCARSLQRFHTRQREMRTRLEAGQAWGLPAFSMTQRWEWARGAYRKITGEDNWGAIGDRIARPPEQRKDMLFFDPKPANYLIPAPPARARGARTLETAHRIDLDLLVLLAPVALQVAIVLFSHPVPIARDADTAGGFREQRRLAHQLAASLGVESTETDDAICYHLTRNWVSAVSDGNRAKSAGLRPWLEECLHQLVGVDTPDTVRRLTSTTAPGTHGGPG
ncbi:hypothetical protein OG949_40735 (plasmid) [Streptomyces scopuliridis]|uniref:hypothetical protein n=1 Tax=Streptomyces scopuliridis TaxID=452529 RepID=UPI002DD9AD0C|nr:hypothetical protein [Streptomyces scopuliridis]WSB39082.1 hypothetical protein OG949_40735 [Streptomyces scopuliridis]